MHRHVTLHLRTAELSGLIASLMNFATATRHCVEVCQCFYNLQLARLSAAANADANNVSSLYANTGYDNATPTLLT